MKVIQLSEIPGLRIVQKIVDKLMGYISRLLKETYVFYLAMKDPKLPVYTRVILSLIVGYAFSPIDIIPDVIPILGQLDDLVILLIATSIAKKLVPKDILEKHKAKADEVLGKDKVDLISFASAILRS